ncbi:hypothetical protein WJX81_001602 [Elliptochloris bilobata]|uniref:Uncharacterized protein n=1 Tax=Elliptochloris bilobata TaxID=381761 RepID=A0AAW1S216_9CHLO
MGENDVVVRRGEAISSGSGPIIVATRNDDLDSVIEATPRKRRPDLVFIQNGMLQPFLDERGLSDNTQVLVYFAVAKRGDAPQDGGLTQAHGPHAAAFAERMTSHGISCSLPDRPQFRQSMLEKLVWICAYMLVGARHKTNVGGVERQHRAEVDALVTELAGAGAAELGIEPAAGGAPLPERLAEYSRSVSVFPTAVKEFVWRNGWFWSLSSRRLAEGRPDPCPRHTALLKEVAPELVT